MLWIEDHIDELQGESVLHFRERLVALFDRYGGLVAKRLSKEDAHELRLLCDAVVAENGLA